MLMHVALGLLTFLSVNPPAAAFAEVGTQVDKVELATVAGGKEPVFRPDVKVNVLVFFRSDQDRSVDALRAVAGCEKELAGKSVHWAAVIGDGADKGEVGAVVAATGIKMPVLVDKGDLLYQRLQIRQHPLVLFLDAKGVLKGGEAFRQLDFADVVTAHSRFLLGELDQAALDKALNPDATQLPGADPMKKALRDVNMARRLYEIGQYDGAVRQAQTALEMAPVPAAFVIMGQAYAKLGKCPQSKNALDQAARSDPQNAEIAQARQLCAGKM
jgi:tetratricopeptide (TPR) repeat protein